MERAVQTWFNRYYGDCLGSNVPIYTVGTEEEEKRVIEEYNYKFLKPITYIATGSDQPPEDRSILNKALSIISAGSITDWIYLLNFWVNSGFYQYTGDISADYKRCVERTKADTYEKAEKVSIKTYTYSLSAERQVKLSELVELKEQTVETVQSTINSEIKTAYNNAKIIAAEYGNLYERDLNSDMYKVENATSYFLTDDGYVYVLYPYGNNDYTNEMDVVIF